MKAALLPGWCVQIKLDMYYVAPICLGQNKKTNKQNYVSSSSRVMQFGYKICPLLFFFFLNGVCLKTNKKKKNTLTWKRKTHTRQNKLQNDFPMCTCWRHKLCLCGKLNIFWVCFWLICESNIKKDRPPT